MSAEANLRKTRGRKSYKHLDIDKDSDCLYVFKGEDREPEVITPEDAYKAAHIHTECKADIERWENVRQKLIEKIKEWKSQFDNITEICLRCHIVCPTIPKLLMIVIHDSETHDQKLADSLADFEWKFSRSDIGQECFFETYEAPEFLKEDTMQNFVPHFASNF